VHLHALHLEVRVPGGLGVGGGGGLQRDAELVLALAGGDLGVGLGVDVGVDPDRDWRLPAQLAGDVVDAGQLGLALDMEPVDPRLEAVPDLRLGLAPANTLAPGWPPAATTRRSSPPLTRSKPAPRLAKWRRIARFELAFIA
jgi:hypothetical protein